MSSRILTPVNHVPPRSPSPNPFKLKRRNPPVYSQENSSPSTKISFHPPPSDRQWGHSSPSQLYAQSPDGIHFPTGVPDFGMTQVTDIHSYRTGLAHTLAEEEEEMFRVLEGSMSASTSASSSVEDCSHYVSLRDDGDDLEVTFPSLNDPPFPTDDAQLEPEQYSADSHLPHLPISTPQSLTWDPTPRAPFSYLAYLKQRAEDARRKEAEAMLVRYRMAVADALLNRLRRMPSTRISRIVFGLEFGRPYIPSRLSQEILSA